MASTSETGHAINVANFEDLIAFCLGYGTAYNPSKNSLKIAQLQTQLTSVRANMDVVTNTTLAYNMAVSARSQAFDNLKKLAPRLVNALDITDASRDLVKSAKAVKAKMLGLRLTKAKTAKAGPALPGTTPVAEDVPKTNSTSQQSYDSMVEHFTRLIAILSTEPTYAPNEVELQVATLNTQLTSLKNANTAVINAYTTLSNARIARNQSLYNTELGLCAVAAQVKKYVKATFGTTAAEYKQLSAIPFRGPKL